MKINENILATWILHSAENTAHICVVGKMQTSRKQQIEF